MISIKELSVKFGNNQVLNNINIDFPGGDIHGIVGLNGAGKTTFFNVLAEILKPDTGQLTLDNQNISIRDAAYLETVNFFYSRITGNEYLKIFKQTNPGFSLSGLQNYFKLPLDELIENYSTGMKKKLALLAVLKQDKPVFILDEPFNGLDLETNKILEIIITTLKQKDKTIFVSSHIIEPLLSICETFEKNDFNKIDNELFGKLRHEANEIISKAI
jgi:ABC-2 type transport system ATP-binding protein